MSVPTTYKRGFTLIELLVVIAIIGLLAAVVLASVGSARSKGADAAVKSELDQARSQAELYASSGSNSYAGVCTASTANNGLSTILANAASSSPKATGVETYTSGTTIPAETATKVICADDTDYWVVQSPLSSDNSFWCSDSTGASKAESAVLPATETSCQ